MENGQFGSKNKMAKNMRKTKVESHNNCSMQKTGLKNTANDMILIPIEKILSNRDSIRKAREAFLIQKGRTIDPDGLNIREVTY